MKIYKDHENSKYYIESEVENLRKKTNKIICIIVAVIVVVYNIEMLNIFIFKPIDTGTLTSANVSLYIMSLTMNIPAIIFWYMSYVQIKTKETQFIVYDNHKMQIGRQTTRQYGKRVLSSQSLYPTSDVVEYGITHAGSELAEDIFESDPESFEYFYKTESGNRSDHSKRILHKKMGYVKFKTETENVFDYLVVSASFEEDKVKRELEQVERMVENPTMLKQAYHLDYQEYLAKRKS